MIPDYSLDHFQAFELNNQEYFQENYEETPRPILSSDNSYLDLNQLRSNASWVDPVHQSSRSN